MGLIQQVEICSLPGIGNVFAFVYKCTLPTAHCLLNTVINLSTCYFPLLGGSDMNKKLAWLFVVAGIMLIAYPSIKEYMEVRDQAGLLEEMNDTYEEAEESAIEEDHEVEVSFEVLYPVDDYDKESISKIMKIPSIDLTVPIVDGISDANLKIAPARFETSKRPGEMGNFAVAGHRYYTYGRDFNRLGEVAVGDKIEIIVGTNSYIYTVTEVFVVKPEEIWVLDDVPGMRTITLVTCTPIGVATHRLIVRGELTEYKKTETRTVN